MKLINSTPIDWCKYLVPGYTDEAVLQWLANMEAVEMSSRGDVLASLPPETQRDLRLRAIHSLPRSAILTMDNATLALYHSEVALELAKLYVDLAGNRAALLAARGDA